MTTSPWVRKAQTNTLPVKDLTGHLITTTTTPPTAWDREVDADGWDVRDSDDSLDIETEETFA